MSIFTDLADAARDAGNKADAAFFRLLAEFSGEIDLPETPIEGLTAIEARIEQRHTKGD